MTLGHRICQLRKERGITQEELAFRMSLDRSAIWRYEGPKADRMTLTMLRRIAAALNVEVDVQFRAKL